MCAPRQHEEREILHSFIAAQQHSRSNSSQDNSNDSTDDDDGYANVDLDCQIRRGQLILCAPKLSSSYMQLTLNNT